MKQHSKYNKEDYSRIVKCNSNRNDFICPECGLSFPISDESIGEGCAIEDADFADYDFWGNRKMMLFSFRFCPKCKCQREKKHKLEYTFENVVKKIFFTLAGLGLVLFILSIIGYILLFCFDLRNDDFTSILGFCVAAFGLVGPLMAVVGLVIYVIDKIISRNPSKTILFDDALTKNAVVKYIRPYAYKKAESKV